MARDEWRRVARGALCFSLSVLGCAPRSPAEAPEAGPANVDGGSPAGGADETSSESAGEGLDARGAGEPARAAPGGPLDDRPPDPSRSLPEITVRHIGMHVGGGTNTPEEKKPLLSALEQKNTAFLSCYKLVSRPLGGGTFGADLYVKTSGGSPEVRATRQRLGDASFDDCMREVLGSVVFPRLERPTVVSYSLRFDVRDPTAP